MTGNRKYYSTRTEKNAAGAKLDLMTLKELFLGVYSDFEEKGYFQEWFGYWCVDAGDVPGKVGRDVDRYLFRRLRKRMLWPISTRCEEYTEETLFDVIELLWDHISKPSGGDYHAFSNCGLHFGQSNSYFDADQGRVEFRTEVNLLLTDYEGGFELSDRGEILVLAEEGMGNLLANKLPIFDPENVDGRVADAVMKFRRYRSAIAERREAVRNLADVLEFLRPRLKDALTRKDESDLFNIANNFGIRHHNEGQKTDYEEELWLHPGCSTFIWQRSMSLSD